MIWNHVNEEKFLFQIGTVIPIVLTNAFHSTDLFFVFFNFFVPSSNVNKKKTCNSSNYFMISLLLQFLATNCIDKNFLVIHINTKMVSFLLFSSFMPNLCDK